ncbi:LysR family transcriptional regulator [Govanella unica]|uniref:LysR family transcriptional regulator n=1 Tax=Govanella unica TaxID=2975056 RepID=A0A9X3Z7L4_9PROT|nr:LysR family transcriptional regulator [Govania unica]MDA5194178.1 LysR family transcriptional regulator [Govania unica]
MKSFLDRWRGVDMFVAVAETGSFTRAGARLGLSVSQVSREIGSLEARLGAQLLIRTTRRVSLTEAGRQFLDRSRRLIDDREAAFESVAAEDNALEGQLRLTCSVSYGERTLVPVINRFIARYPRITVDIELTNRLLDLVADGMDMGVRSGDMFDARLHRKPLGSRSLHLCAAPDYLKAHGVPASVFDLHNHNCLLGSADRWLFNGNGQETQIRPPARWRCNSGFAVLDAALNGLGICQLPDFYVRDHIANNRLVEILTAERPEDQVIWAAYPDRSHQRRKVTTLIAFLQQELATTP